MLSEFFNFLGSNALVRKIVSKMHLSPRVLSKLALLAKPRKSKSTMIREMHSQIEDLNFKINLLMDYYIDPVKAKRAQGKRAIEQANMLNLLSEFDRICKKLNMIYWLDFGTLLGAKRHSGFVPWDEDADCGVLYNDLIANIDLIKKEISPQFEFRVNKSNGEIIYAGIKNKDKSYQSYLDIYAYLELNDRLKIKLNSFKIPHITEEVPRSIIMPTSKIIFEGKEFSAPADIDCYLKGRYGNYHVLPKKSHTYLHNWDARERFFKD